MEQITDDIWKMNTIIEKLNRPDFPFEWADLEYLPDSNAERKEIYTLQDENLAEELIMLFYSLFRNRKSEIIIFYKSWWDFCLDTWDPNSNEIDYDIETGTKSEECKAYLKMLSDSGIEQGYGGCCKCLNWDAFLPIVLRCIIDHHAPYSPVFCDEENKYFFYFHHSGSIGLYYKEENEVIRNILEKGHADFRVESVI